MRTLIGYKAASVAAIATTLAAIALTAQAQVSVQTSVSGSVGAGSNGSANAGMKATVTSDSDDKGYIRAKASTTPNASINATLHANENSAVIRGNERQNDKDDASTTVTASSTDRDEGTPRKMTARFLGIFPVSITAHVVADADGREEVKLPWYAFLFKVMASANANASTTASVR